MEGFEEVLDVGIVVLSGADEEAKDDVGREVGVVG